MVGPLFFAVGQLFYSLMFEIRFVFGNQSITQNDIQTLQEHFPYFGRLTTKRQREFTRKLAFFISIKRFVPRGGLKQVSREMVILISATAVMVAFGYRRVNYRHFRTILVYPDNYYSTITKQYHKGEVNPKLGIIVVSWSNFTFGLEGEKDGINLGIHEMAHALKLENQIHYNQESNFFNPRDWQAFLFLARREIDSMTQGAESVFRQSAARDLHEFFAVALETFFEKPEELRVTKPAIYKVLVSLLRQDPLDL